MQRQNYLAIFLTIVILGISGCSMFSPLIGKWQDTSTKDTLEFTRGGDLIIKTDGYVFTGKYELVGDDVIKANLDGISGAWASLFGGDNWEYSISGNSLTLTIAGRSSNFEKVTAEVPTKTTPLATPSSSISPIPTPSSSIDTSVRWSLSTPISSLPQPPSGYGYWKGPSGYNLAPLGSALPNNLYSWVELTPTPNATK